MTISAWFMDSTDEDQRCEHRKSPNEEVSLEKIASLGVLHWSGITGPEDPKLAEIQKERGYSYTDIISVCPDKLPGYEDKVKSFFTEHIHYDEEIRYCIEGNGYFDVRDSNDQWIRIKLEGGDMIILPEGSYHRFTTTESNYIKAMRLFVGEPVWTPYNRTDIDNDTNESRVKYVSSFLQTASA
jgi:1,2-dihydroxy-3-keto-5-methylthiopentene dioxygenase